MLRSSWHFPIHLSKISATAAALSRANRFAKVVSHVTKMSLVVKLTLAHARQETRRICSPSSHLSLAVRDLSQQGITFSAISQGKLLVGTNYIAIKVFPTNLLTKSKILPAFL